MYYYTKVLISRQLFLCSFSKGVQKHIYVCVGEDTNNHLEEHNCESAPPPTPPHTTCQLSACPPRWGSHCTFSVDWHAHSAQFNWEHMNNLLSYRWETGMFGPCSASCGGGERVRPVRCVQRNGADVVKVPDSECGADEAPNAVEKCNLPHCPARWKLIAMISQLRLVRFSFCFFLTETEKNHFFLLWAILKTWQVP